MKKADYICIHPEAESARLVSFFLETLGIEDAIPMDELHVSLVTSETKEFGETAIELFLDRDVSYTATVEGLEVMGDGDFKAVVLTLASPELLVRHKELSGMLGNKFDGFKPHLSMKYGPTDFDVEKLQKHFSIIQKTLPTITLRGESVKSKREG